MRKLLVENYNFVRYRFAAALRSIGFIEGIGVGSQKCGFFGNVLLTLRGLRECEAAGVPARPLWDRECLYLDPKRGKNAWDVFFEAPKDLEGRPVNWPSEARCLRIKPHFKNLPLDEGKTMRETMARLIKQYTCVRPEIAKAIDTFAKGHFEGCPVLGVHIRRTDAIIGLEGKKRVELEDFEKEINLCLELQPDFKLFVATDSSEVIDWLRERYGGRMIERAVIRSKDGRSIHGHYDEGVQASAYQKGLEVIGDAILLSRCQYLIRTASAVTNYALLKEPELPFTDLSMLVTGENPQPWLTDVPHANNKGSTIKG